MIIDTTPLFEQWKQGEITFLEFLYLASPPDVPLKLSDYMTNNDGE